ncbi:MAG: hypothetical protein ACXAD7_14065, partial [Candidatus Kariarchaeaceae archaeon]
MSDPHLFHSGLQSIVEEYAPLFCFHKDEPFFPVPVDVFIDIAALSQKKEDNGSTKVLLHPIRKEHFEVTNDDDVLIVFETSEKTRNSYQSLKEKLKQNVKFLKETQKLYLDINGMNNFCIYSHYFVTGQCLTVSYYLFYLGNEIHETTFLAKIGRLLKRVPKYTHDCDWELVRVHFKLNEGNWLPQYVTFAQHDSLPINPDPRVAWDDLKDHDGIIDGTRVIVYPSLGGHASFYKKKRMTPSAQLGPRNLNENTDVARFTSSDYLTIRITRDNQYNPLGDLNSFPIGPSSLDTNEIKLQGQYKLISLNEPVVADITNFPNHDWLNFKGDWGLKDETIPNRIKGPKFFTQETRRWDFSLDSQNNCVLDQQVSAEYHLIQGFDKIEQFDHLGAKESLEKSKDIAEKNPNLRVYGWINVLLETINKMEESDQVSPHIFLPTGDDALASILLHLGVKYESQKLYIDARRFYQKSYELYSYSFNKIGEMTALSQLLDCLDHIGHLDKSTHQKDFDWIFDGASNIEKGRFYQESGYLKYELRQFERAVTYFLQSNEYFSMENDEEEEAINMYNLGILNGDYLQKDRGEVQDYYYKSAQKFSKLKNQIGESYNYLKLGDFDIGILDTVKNKVNIFQDYGDQAYQNQNWGLAKEMYQNYLHLLEKIGDQYSQILIYQRLASIELNLNNMDLAKQLFLMQKSLSFQSKNNEQYLVSLINLGYIELINDDINLAMSYLQECLDIVATSEILSTFISREFDKIIDFGITEFEFQTLVTQLENQFRTIKLPTVLEHRTEDLHSSEVYNYFVPMSEDQHLKLIDNQAYLVEGNRGIGKSMLLRYAETYADRHIDEYKICTVYVTYSESLKLTQFEQAGYDYNIFRQWTISKILLALLRKAEILGLTNKVHEFREFMLSISSLDNYKLLEDALSEYIGLLESYPSISIQSLREQTYQLFQSYNIEISEDPRTNLIQKLDSITFLKYLVSKFVKDFDLVRVVFLFDECAHSLVPSQQVEFFTIFKSLRSPEIASKAAVYPLITTYGSLFDPHHDAKKVSFDLSEKNPSYLTYFTEILTKRIQQYTAKHDFFKKNKSIVDLIAYCAFGNPRHFFTILDEVWERTSDGTLDPQNILQDSIKDYCVDSGGLFDYLRTTGKKYPKYASHVSIGEQFIRKSLIQILRDTGRKRREQLINTVGNQWYEEKFSNDVKTISKPSIYFAIDENILRKHNLMIELLLYTNLISYRKYLNLGKDGYGSVYALNIAIAYQENILKRTRTPDHTVVEIDHMQ